MLIQQIFKTVMKKNLMLWMTMISMVLFFSACDTEDDDKAMPDDNLANEQIT